MSANPVPASRPDPVQQLFQAAGGYVISSSLWVATELKIADQLAAGPKSVAELARATNTKDHALGRILRALAMVGIFTETAPDTFALTPTAELLRSDVAGSQYDTVLWICDPFHFAVNAELLHSVKTGQPAVEKVAGKPCFEALENNPVENRRFNAAMTNMSATQVPAILEAYDFSRFETIVDIAGGHGFLICEVLKKYPNTRGILFDLEHVLKGAPQRIQAARMESRCATVSGDFFQAVPAGGDLYVMKHIIHDWNDEKAGQILTNCRKALTQKPKGRVLLFEMVRPEGDTPHGAKILDIEMLVFPGGHERTEDQFRQLFAKNSLRLTRIIPTNSPMSIVEAEVV